VPIRIAPLTLLAVTGLLTGSSCTWGNDPQVQGAAGLPVVPPPGCDLDNGGLTLPPGFCATVFADDIGHARHIAVGPAGTVFVNTWNASPEMTSPAGGFVVALPDLDHDGHADRIERFGSTYHAGQVGGGTGIATYGNSLFVEDGSTIVRYVLIGDGSSPKDEPQIVVDGLPLEGDHQMHSFAIAGDGTLYVNSGSMSNSCQEVNRARESRGRKPCSELATHAGIWRYSTSKPNQTFSPHDRMATGLRNTVALAVDGASALFAVTHGRDQLSDTWPKLYTPDQNNDQPAETLERIQQGQDFGWPFCYFDATQDKYVLAPEYGGDGGKAVGECARKTQPIMTFPAHWAPESMVFQPASGWPSPFQNGVFIAFHGSWNRHGEQAGFLVVFVPIVEGQPAAPHQTFITGFAGTSPPTDPSKAQYRPVGLAFGPGNALYVADDTHGRVWRIIRTPGK